MDTPICDFVESYRKGRSVRLHMPGHKGASILGAEPWDITEIDGADSLFEASGIIAKSEQNASSLFGCPTFYSTEGSSLAIRAMVYLSVLRAKEQGQTPCLLAGRNAHKTFLSAVALLDVPVRWLTPGEGASYLSCPLTAADVEAAFRRERPTALYLTSPDYLGNQLDLSSIAKVCRRYGVLLLVDNAHGAYLKFLPTSQHPMDLGADLCCDSAHKTLSVLTGGAYLHLSPALPTSLLDRAKDALSLFASTSPSYLILASLDMQNAILSDGFAEKVKAFTGVISDFANALLSHGYEVFHGEPFKITLQPKGYGYTGTELFRILKENGIHCEFCDPDHLVMMMTPCNTPEDFCRTKEILCALPRKTPITETAPPFSLPEKVLSPRDAILSSSRILPVDQIEGHICAFSSVSCPPAVPIVMSGERIDAHAVKCMRYYGITSCAVVD